MFPFFSFSQQPSIQFQLPQWFDRLLIILIRNSAFWQTSSYLIGGLLESNSHGTRSCTRSDWNPLLAGDTWWEGKPRWRIHYLLSLMCFKSKDNTTCWPLYKDRLEFAIRAVECCLADVEMFCCHFSDGRNVPKSCYNNHSHAPSWGMSPSIKI